MTVAAASLLQLPHDAVRSAALDGAPADLQECDAMRVAVEHALHATGKGLRASLVLESARHGREPAHPLVTTAAIGIELVHLASLVHDDLIDDAATRRGERTVAAEFGPVAAAMAGGWLLARAFELMGDCDSEVFREAASAADDVCNGQMLEQHHMLDATRTTDDYLACIGGKTARLFALSAWGGAHIAGADAEICDELSSYGTAVGMIFQITDDILDVAGDPGTTGKAAGTDLLHGIYTLPALYAARQDAELAEQLVIGVTRETLADVLARIQRCDAVAYARAECERYAQAARAHAEAAGALSGAGTHPLQHIVDRSLDRLS